MNSAVTLVDFDRLLNGLDHIYSEFSRACGLSDCAYWMLVDTSTAGGSIAVSRLTSEWFYSKQTINSAIKTLTARGFATVEFAEGSRKKRAGDLPSVMRCRNSRPSSEPLARLSHVSSARLCA